MINNINNINDNMIKNNQDFSNRIESLQEKIELRSRASSKASSRANSPDQLMAKLHAKLSAGEEPKVIETPRIVAPEDEVPMTAIFKDKWTPTTLLKIYLTWSVTAGKYSAGERILINREPLNSYKYNSYVNYLSK
jgi:hypothetical protein